MDLLRVETLLFYGAFASYFLSMVLFILYFVNKNDKQGAYGRNMILLGFAIHTLALVARTINAGRLPLSNQYEFATSFAWGIALSFLIFEKKFNFRALGTFVTPILFLIIGYAAMRDKTVNPLMPALQSRWLSIHVGLAITSYGSFAVAAGIAGMYVLRDKFNQDHFFKANIPETDKLDDLSYRAIAAGFLFLSLVIITGAIWAEAAWGRYWAWDPKETWSLITWIIYSIYLHLRISKGWRGRRAAWFAIIGFICVIFTYVGVNTLLPSLHSYL